MASLGRAERWSLAPTLPYAPSKTRPQQLGMPPAAPRAHLSRPRKLTSGAVPATGTGNAFELGAQEGSAALARGRDERYRDVRAACSLLRTFLLELAQPLVPVDFFLPLLRGAQACERCEPAEVVRQPRRKWAC